MPFIDRTFDFNELIKDLSRSIKSDVGEFAEFKKLRENIGVQTVHSLFSLYSC